MSIVDNTEHVFSHRLKLLSIKQQSVSNRLIRCSHEGELFKWWHMHMGLQYMLPKE